MFSFHLSDAFIDSYRNKPVDFGYVDASGTNSLGEITLIRSYSRKKEDGTKERWFEICERVINGMFSLQRDWCKTNRLPWYHGKAQRSAQDAYERMFCLKWSPPGRGLWAMGSPLTQIHKNSGALQNCSFVSSKDMTRENPTAPFTFIMDASMHGVGCGFDLLGAGKKLPIYQPLDAPVAFTIPDSREGWVESLKLLLESYWKPERHSLKFDYSEIRAAGLPLKTFGGIAPGPDPLIRFHQAIRDLFDGRQGDTITATDIADVGNLVGVCVVSGNLRRSAEIMLGPVDDEFLSLKNYDSELGQRRAAWSWMSNNSVLVNVGDDLSKVIPGIIANGEPGIVWQDMSRNYSRLADQPDYKDHRVLGVNPCGEISLESYEMCTLAESYINRHDSLEDYKKTLKVAYLYGKSVTLMSTTWQETNAVMQRNRRIGMSMSGIANFADSKGVPELRRWMDEGYHEIQRLDKTYSEWLCVRESIKTTTVKPSGSVSLLSGSSPGVHWAPGGSYFLRSIRFGKDDPMVQLLRWANYRVEPAESDPDSTVVVYFPVKSEAKRSEKEVSLFEKAALAVLAQRWWSDNSVSVTLSFDREKEAQHIGTILSMYEGQLKTVSFLPMLKEGSYAQMPYGTLTEEEYEAYTLQLLPIDWSPIYDGQGLEALGESYCQSDSCDVKEFKLNAVEAQS